MASNQSNVSCTRRLLYFAIVLVLAAICIGARTNVDPIYLAVGFISEIILVCTVHLSSVLQKLCVDARAGDNPQR